MKAHAVLVVNPASGSDSPGPEELAVAARGLGVEVRLLEPGTDPGELARQSGAAILGVAGGDGSLAAVAAAALETDAAFVCIPFGTRNHFARDLGLDRNDPLAALAAFRDDAHERRIDVGRVGDRVFLNNVSLGAYAGLVHRREHHRRRGEALARLRALGAAARHRHRLHATVNDEPTRARVLLVGNNEYELSLFTLGARERLDEGVLQVWAAAGLLPRHWHDRVAPRVEIGLPNRRVRAAIDGEPALLEPPLVFESLPRALRVRIPPAESDSSEGGAMHDNPEPTEEEQELNQTERGNEEESQRYPSPGQPDSPEDASE